ncbi:efflux RND transporter periplasmic adaptor subunit [Brevundimonas sp.]|uniref:efflux RND transporter periplasmic adaptor subunit n=1 Tax=Brevundimonas sp. TaxID=1871086 RepID=UPI0025DE6AF3|nr:efflux RND transporter periplasmic adaptor subunit [Brevundimonas sp.]
MFSEPARRVRRIGPRTRIAAIVVAVVAVAVVLFLLFGRGGGEEKAEATPGEGVSSQTVTVAVASTQDLARVVTASGTVSAWEEVPVGAETGGLTATAVLTDEGRYVRQGQVLVQLNDTLLRAQLRQQDASVASAQANLEQANNSLARARELREQGFLSQAALDARIAEQATAQAQVSAAQAARAETAARLAQASIRAPVSGLVISRSVTRGQIVQPGTELFRIVRDGRLELDAQVPETELALVRPGQSAEVSSDDVGQTSGTVRIVTPEVDPQTRLGVARIALAGAGGLRPGMFARAQIDVGAQATVVVPSGAVIYRENRAGVFVVGDQNTVTFQPVTVLARRDALTSVAGLAEGVRVVVEGAGFLSQGDRIRVAPAAR